MRRQGRNRAEFGPKTRATVSGVRGLLVAFLAIAALAGCQPPPQPYAAESNLILTDEEAQTRLLLDAAQRAEADAALRSVATGASIVDPPRPAPGGVRWADVEPAAADACDELLVAVFRTEREPGRFVFHIRTAAERRATLVVMRVDDERIYEATATAGLFEDDGATARRLLEAFDKAMRDHGKRRKYDDEPR